MTCDVDGAIRAEIEKRLSGKTITTKAGDLTLLLLSVETITKKTINVFEERTKEQVLRQAIGSVRGGNSVLVGGDYIELSEEPIMERGTGKLTFDKTGDKVLTDVRIRILNDKTHRERFIPVCTKYLSAKKVLR